MKNDLIESLLSVADEYAAKAGVAEKTLSFRVFGDSKTIGLLRAGSDITTGRLQAAMEWMSDRWPENAVWPKGVRRPRQVA